MARQLEGSTQTPLLPNSEDVRIEQGKTGENTQKIELPSPTRIIIMNKFSWMGIDIKILAMCKIVLNLGSCSTLFLAPGFYASMYEEENEIESCKRLFL